MAQCELRDSCIFFNGQTKDMPHTRDYLKSLYCNGARFTDCALFSIYMSYGADKVPANLYPNDAYKLLDLNLAEPQEDLDMYLKVIYTGGASGWVRPSTLKDLQKSGRIIAFHYSAGWVEVRRTYHGTYRGFNRRRNNPEMFFASYSID